MSAMSAVYIQQRVWRVTRSHDLWHVLSTLQRTITKSTLHVVWRYRILVRTPSMYCARCTCDFNTLLMCAYPIAYWSLTNPLLFSYQSPLLLQILLTPPYVYKLLLAVCQCKQSVPCFKVVLKTSLSLYCALSVCFCQPLSSLWVL